jgi:inhibitor of KinA sporulation pathway (predicted exonuclease)
MLILIPASICDREVFQRKNDLNVVQPFPYLVVLDFECTCEDTDPHFLHEIIEFPAVLIRTDTKEVVGEFRKFVRPVEIPRLTNFCMNLTKIQQSDVDSANALDQTIAEFECWLKEKGLQWDPLAAPETFNFALATDGPWDLHAFLFRECNRKKMPFPAWGRQWVNVRKLHQDFYGTLKRYGIRAMLSFNDLQFKGQEHSGIDDARNLAQIAFKLAEKGALFTLNDGVAETKTCGWELDLSLQRYREEGKNVPRPKSREEGNNVPRPTYFTGQQTRETLLASLRLGLFFPVGPVHNCSLLGLVEVREDFSPLDPHPNNNRFTFQAFYKKTCGLSINASQPLLHAVPFKIGEQHFKSMFKQAKKPEQDAFTQELKKAALSAKEALIHPGFLSEASSKCHEDKGSCKLHICNY